MYRDLAANVARHGRTLGLATADLKLLPALVADLETVRDPAADLAISASALDAFGAWLVGQERSEATRSRDSTTS
jgi:hypothetical protein